MSSEKRRSRPRREAVLTPDRARVVRGQWNTLLNRIKPEVHELLAQRLFFHETIAILRANPSLRKPNAYVRWVLANYSVAAAVGVRKQLDRDLRSASLWRLLYLILQHPDALTMESHASKYPRMVRDHGTKTFHRLFGPRSVSAAPRALRADLRALEQSGARVQRLVNKRIAHLGSPGGIRRLPTYGDLDEAVKTIERIYIKYHLALTGQGLTQMTPVPQTPWKWILSIPWIEEAIHAS